MKEREKTMSIKSYIEIDSVGSMVQEDGLVFPIDCSEAPETASDADEMSGVNIFECSDEWYWTLSLVDGYKLLDFMDTYIGWYEGSQIHGNYEQWKEKVKGLMGRPDTFVEVV